MKIKALIFALALSSFAFGQKAMVSYQYTIGGNPYGAEAHIFIPKTKWAFFASYNWTSQKQGLYEKPYYVLTGIEAEQGYAKSYAYREDGFIFRSNQYTFGLGYLVHKNILVQAGAGRYLRHTYSLGKFAATQEGTWVFFDDLYRNTNLHVGTSILFAKYLRAGVGYDTAPGKLTVSLGAVIR